MECIPDTVCGLVEGFGALKAICQQAAEKASGRQTPHGEGQLSNACTNRDPVSGCYREWGAVRYAGSIVPIPRSLAR